ncbi:hypothetical protein [Saudi moumouvirus]|uniref:Uncharacterized protein n=1 Tax=Moumouvirus sp. 'Monve' TaxID=1128131 RepID=H2EFM5_9VIRU|nr:hypothetical protein mv_R1088 [Moumouvirus Monve]AQN67908.1 hypothetical protein [Saudi moumouvirus]
MQVNTEIVSNVHSNFKFHPTTKFPLGFDRFGILRYRNIPGGSYANAAVHGLVFDFSRMENNSSIQNEITATFVDRKSDIEPLHYPENDSDSEDFIESREYELEVTYGRGIRLHGETKKTTPQIVVRRKSTQQKSRECKHALKRNKKQKQKVYLKSRQNKLDTLDVTTKKCQNVDAIWIKNHGWTHISKTILLDRYYSDSDDEEDLFWGYPFDIGTPEQESGITSSCTCAHCTKRLSEIDILSDSEDDDALSFN